MMDAAPQFTAAQFAGPLGVSTKTARRLLGGTPASGRTIVSGNEAPTWTIAALPSVMREQLDARRLTAPEFRNVEHMVREWGKGFAPARPVSTYAPEAIALASKYRDAFRSALTRGPEFAAGDSERRGMQEYQAAFGEGVSARHWRRLLDKFKGRWRAPGDFDRIDLYLSDDASGATIATRTAAPAVSGIIPELEVVVKAFTDPAHGTPKEIENLWTRALEYFEAAVSDGESEKSARRRVLKFLRCFAQGIAKSENGLQIQFSRKWAAWKNANGDLSAVRDRRREASGFKRAPEITDQDLRVVTAHMAGTFRNQAVPAFWYCLRKGLLSAAVADYYRDKKECPRRLLARLASVRDALADEHLGGNKTEMARPKIHRKYDGVVFSNDWHMADDLTICCYCYVPDQDGGYRLIRPQVLVTIDFRSCCILGYALIPQASYNARAIRSMFTRVADEHGLPRRGYYLENGIWRTAKLLTGNKAMQGAMSLPEIEQGLRGHGLEFRHAGAGKPWVKPIERVFDRLQMAFFSDPGYCGTDERKNCPEEFKRLKLDVEAQRKSPVGKLYSFEELERRFEQVCNAFNHTKQPSSEMLKGMSPMEAYQEFQKADDPISPVRPEIRYLFASERYEVTVSRHNGIRIGQRRYVCAATGELQLQGRRVIAWFDPEREDIVVTDLERKNVWIAERFAGDEVPAIGGGEQLALAMRQSSEHVKPIKTLYRSLKAEFPLAFRKVITTARQVELGAKIAATREAFEHEKTRTARAKASVERKAQSIGIPRQILADDTDAVARGQERLKRSGINLGAMTPTDGGEARP